MGLLVRIVLIRGRSEGALRRLISPVRTAPETSMATELILPELPPEPANRAKTMRPTTVKGLPLRVHDRNREPPSWNHQQISRRRIHGCVWRSGLRRSRLLKRRGSSSRNVLESREVAAANALPTRVGIGLHAGEAVTGSIGSALRKEYAVFGDVVKVA